MTGPMWHHDVTICLNIWSDMRRMIQFVTLKDCQFCFLYFDMRFNDFGSCLDCFLRIVSQSSGTDLVFKESGLPRPHVGRPAAMDLRPRVFNQIKWVWIGKRLPGRKKIPIWQSSIYLVFQQLDQTLHQQCNQDRSQIIRPPDCLQCPLDLRKTQKNQIQKKSFQSRAQILQRVLEVQIKIFMLNAIINK